MKPRSFPCLGALLALPLIVAPLTSQGPPTAVVFPREPVVIYETVATSVFENTHIHLIAYADGHVSYSRSGSVLLQSSPVSLSLAVDPKAVRGLARALRDAGAATLEDNVTVGLPVTTVSLLAPTPTALAHSFSYGTFSADHLGVQVAINAFLASFVLPNVP
jgi:hypothetical protein